MKGSDLRGLAKLRRMAGIGKEVPSDEKGRGVGNGVGVEEAFEKLGSGRKGRKIRPGPLGIVRVEAWENSKKYTKPLTLRPGFKCTVDEK